MKRFFLALWLSLLTSSAFGQAIIGAMPFQLANGTVADANQVMANFNYIASQTNANAATAGANSNITSLNGLTTPIPYTSGGTSSYIGGTGTNSGNAYVVASPTPLGFTLVNGKTVSFTVPATNTGPSTLNVAGTGVTNFYKQTAAGAVVMTGGELVTGMVAIAFYDGTQYQCLNCETPSLVPTGTVVDFTGVVVPAGWILAAGQAVSRTTFSALYATLAFVVSATTVNGNANITVPNSALFQVGWSVGGSNVTCNSTITNIPNGTTITISANAGAGGATTLNIGPFQQGDCSTTFNLPNYTGRAGYGIDGTTNITATSCTNAGSVGTTCGQQTRTLAVANLPAFTPAGTITGFSVTVNTKTSNYNIVGGGSAPVADTTGNNGTTTAVASATGSANFTGTSTSGTMLSTPIPTLPPAIMISKIIKT